MAAVPSSARRFRPAPLGGGGAFRLRRLVLCLSAALVLAAPPARADTITVGSKIDEEGTLLGTMIVLLLQKDGLNVASRVGLGPTSIVRAALLAGEIDLYPEYTGNGAQFFHREADPVWRDAAAGYALVKKLDRAQNHLVWLAPAPADNSWAIAARRALADATGGSLEGLARYVAAGKTLRLAASAEFVESPLGLPAFEDTYHFTLGQSQLLVLAGGDTSATLRAAAEAISGVDAAMAYGTDGAVAALGLSVLADDRGAEIVYEPAPVIREATLAAHPEIATLLDPVFRSLTLARLQQLNAKVAVDGAAPRAVAQAYLEARGFWR